MNNASKVFGVIDIFISLSILISVIIPYVIGGPNFLPFSILGLLLLITGILTLKGDDDQQSVLILCKFIMSIGVVSILIGLIIFVLLYGKTDSNHRIAEFFLLLSIISMSSGILLSLYGFIHHRALKRESQK